MTLRVLAVCAGNICRSPLAQAAIRQAAEERGLDVEVDSAGTGAWNVGEPPTTQGVEAGSRVGLEVRGRARRVNKADVERFDVILAMDRSNLRDLLEMAPSLEARAKIRLFRTYDPTSDEEEIPDPYGGSDEGYDETARQVVAAAQGFADSLESAGVEDPVPLQ
jgi:protein-tyrosine phosphatase